MKTVRRAIAAAVWALVMFQMSPVAIQADGTKTWTQSKYEEFSKGTATNVAIDNSGVLELAPEIRQIAATPSTYLWSLAVDDAGYIYAAAGSPARVYQISPDGMATVIFEAKELQVQAVVVAAGVLYAATAPDGKLFRLERPDAKKTEVTKPTKAESSKSKTPASESDRAGSLWAATEVFAPKAKYIWSLAADGQGNVYAATGDPGEIYKITPKGDHSLLFKSDETHIRALAVDAKGNVIAGSDPSGLVYRISPSGEAFVLYSAPKKEITALTVDAAGEIYASGTGEKKPGPASGSTPAILSLPAPAVMTTPQPAQAPTAMPVPSGVVGFSPLAFTGAAGVGSEIYKISADGTPVRWWSSHEDLVYGLAVTGSGQLMAGTGNRGKMVTITGVDEFLDSGKATSAQVIALAWARNGVLYAATSNLGKIFAIGPKLASKGTFESDVFDAKTNSRWGRVEFRGAGNVELFVRSGNVENPDRNWSPWKKVDLEKGPTAAQLPAARFAQWKAVLHADSSAPRVESVTLNYLPRNVAPVVDEVAVQAGVRYQIQPKTPSSGTGPETGGSAFPHFESPPPSTHDRDAIGVKWTAHDDDDDQLVYSIYYRGDGESQWLLLKDKITDKAYSFDANLLPDGGYVVRVVASDAPSQSPGEALTGSKESSRFEVDTTPPRVEGLAASFERGEIRVRFHAVDSFSPISKAECSIDAGDWQYVEPVGQISDSKTEDYDFRLPGSSGQEHVVVVRVYDRYENVGAAKTVLRAK